MLNKETTYFVFNLKKAGWTGRQQEQKNCPVLEKEVFMLTEARHCNNDSHTADCHFKMRFYVVFANVMYPFVLWKKWQHCFFVIAFFQ